MSFPRPANTPWLVPYLTVLDPEDPGGPGLPLDWCDDLCDVDGRSPAWSPTDPGTIAYVDHGSLWTVEVAVTFADGLGDASYFWRFEVS